MAASRSKKSNSTSADDSKQVDVDWLECSSCGGWDVFENYKTGQPYIPSKLNKEYHLCRSCRMEQAIQKCYDEITTLTQKVRELENVQTAYSSSTADFSIRPHTTPSNDSQVHSSERLTSQISQTADEVFEIAKRKLNVIIRGLPENENDIEEFVQFAICQYFPPSSSNFGGRRHCICTQAWS